MELECSAYLVDLCHMSIGGVRRDSPDSDTFTRALPKIYI